MAPEPSVSHNPTLASYQLMQSGEPAAPSASPRAASVFHPAPGGICLPQSLLASPEGATILDRTPCFPGNNSQLLPPLPTPAAKLHFQHFRLDGWALWAEGPPGGGLLVKGSPCPCEMG